MSPREIRADLAVIGAGSAGLSAASGAAQLGLKTVLFEAHEMGGDCLNTGCVPSKALIAAAATVKAARDAARFGLAPPAGPVDFDAVRDHVRAAIEAIAPHDSQERFEGLGVTVVRERARLTGPHRVESAGVRVRARRIVVATGSRSVVPDIEGLAAAAPLTAETVWDLTSLPARLAVLGAGPIGVELGQAFARLGAEVTLIEKDRLLPREDPDLAETVRAQLEVDGLSLREGRTVRRVTAADGGSFALTLDDGSSIVADKLLVAAGRIPNLENLGLEGIGARFENGRPILGPDLRLAGARSVFLLGDAAGGLQFTHLAGAHASLFVRSALFAQKADASALTVPRVVYADPELAVVGLTETEAKARWGDRTRVETAPFSGNDRAIAEGDRRGLAKLVRGPDGRIAGAALVGAGAGELILPWTLAIRAGLSLRAFTDAIVPYPTRSEIHKRLASQVYAPLLFSDRTRLLVSLLKRFG